MDQTDAFWTPRAIVVLEVSLALSTTTASVHVLCEQASSVKAGLAMPREAVACHRDRLPFQFAPLPEPRQSTISRDGRRLVGPMWCLLSALPKGVPQQLGQLCSGCRQQSMRSEELSSMAVLTKSWTRRMRFGLRGPSLCWKSPWLYQSLLQAR